MEKILLGKFGVDSGQVLIIDPCYLDDWKDGEVNFDIKKFLNDYDECCKNTIDDKQGGEISKGGVVSCTGYGDGEYPVYATVEDGRVKELTIKFF